MKVCKKCNQEKEYLEFYKHKATKDGYDSWCKACNRNSYQNGRLKDPATFYAYVKKSRVSTEDGYHSVYLLPYEHYVGTTKNIVYRMTGHRNKGKDISSYIVLGRFKHRDEALQLEKVYHSQGYNGKHINNSYK